MRSFRKALTVLCVMLFPASGHAAAYHNVGAWFKTQYYKLQFTTGAQSIYAENCSGYLNVQTKNPSGSVFNVPSNLTVSLSGPAGVTFYSDSACTNAVTTVTVPSGSNSVNFYFIDTSTGSVTLTASATKYLPANQTETLSTNPFIWTGAGGDAQWSTAANWSGGAAPSSSKYALFKGAACSTNCSPTISSSINVYGIRMASDYAGTITQSAGKTITVGFGGWVQLAGSFVGSSSGDAISVGNSNLVINGGSFTSTSGNLSFGDGSNYYQMNLTVAAGATFNHNAGTLSWSAPCASHSISTGAATFNNVTFGGNCPTFALNSGTMNIAGNLNINNIGYGGHFNAGTLAVGGNVTSTGPNGYDGSMVIQLTGNAAGQTISNPGGGVFNHLTISAGTNPVTLSGTVTITGNYTVNSVGTFTATGSTLYFNDNAQVYTIAPKTEAYNNVTFGGNFATYSLGGNTMTISGDLTFNNINSGVVNSGTLAVAGNVTANGPNQFSGTGVVKLTGNASGQTVSMPSSGAVPNLTIETGTNPVTLSGTVTVRGSYVLNSVGTLTVTGSTLSISGSAATNYTLTPGSVTYNNVVLSSYYATYSMGGGTMNIAGDLTYATNGTTTLNSGTLSVSGNFTAANSSFFSGTVALQFVGTGVQTITSGASNLPGGAVVINKPSGSVVLASSVSNTNSSWTLTAGTLYMSGYNLALNGLSLNSNTVHRKDSGATTAAGVLTVNGTTYGNGSYLGGTVAD